MMLGGYHFVFGEAFASRALPTLECLAFKRSLSKLL